MVSKPKGLVAAFAVVGLALLAGSMTAAGAQTGGIGIILPTANGNTANVAGQVPANVRGPDTALLLTEAR
jgi:hypothetical protein